MTSTSEANGYENPVSRLLSVGEVRNSGKGSTQGRWLDYTTQFGFTPAHVPELIRMACDPQLNGADGESLIVWAPAHAWRALGQLKAVEAVKPLLDLAATNNDDWLFEDLPKVFCQIGPDAIPDIEVFLEKGCKNEWAIIAAINGIKEIAQQYQVYRDNIIAIAVKVLGRYSSNDHTANASIISMLMDLNAVEAIDIIREAFQADKVDLSVAGDVEEVEIEFGLRTERTTPARDWIFETGKFANTGLAELTKSLRQRFSSTRSQAAAVAQPKQVQSHRNVGRNDPCPCGSGKKFKKCCLQ